jgi:hypothetical protein
MDSEEIAYLYRDVFESDRRGALILEDLVQRFSRPMVTKGGIDAVLQSFARGGERNVVDHIVRQINRANGVRDTQEGEQP